MATPGYARAKEDRNPAQTSACVAFQRTPTQPIKNNKNRF
jgi:hypothetical protein